MKLKYYIIIEMTRKERELNKIFDMYQNGSVQEAFLQALELEREFCKDVEVISSIAGLYEAKNDINNAIKYYIKGILIEKDNVFINFKLADNLYILRRRNELLFKEYIEEWKNIVGNNVVFETSMNFFKKRVVGSKEEYVRLLFDNFADSFDRVLKGLSYYTPKKVGEKVGLLSNSQLNIIDIGCGTGLCGEQVRKFCKGLTGIDLSEKMIEKAREKSIYDKLFCGNFLDKEKQGELGIDYDIAISGDVFTYFVDISEPLRAVKTLLRKNGYFIVSFSLLSGFNFKEVDVEASGRYLHNMRYLKREIKGSGFKIILIETYNQRKELNQTVKGALFVLEKR